MLRVFPLSILAALTALAALSGCNVYHEMVGKPRVGTQVAGERHIPVENQQDLAKQPVPAPMTAPASAPSDAVMLPESTLPPPALPPQDTAMPAPVNPADADPYDYYDRQGHPVAPRETAHTPSPQSSLNVPGNNEAMRKLLPDNRYTANQMQMAQALSSEDVPMPPAVTDNARSAPSSSSSHPSFFARLFGSHDEQLSAADKAAENAPYPALSSVPPTPPELQSERVVNPQGMQQLENDWQAAQQDKQSLDAEPSSLPSQASPAAGTVPATN